MSDNQRVFRKVAQTLKKKMKGIPEKYIAVWGMMVAGIIQGKSARLNSIAEETPGKAKNKSVFRRLQRFVSNDRVDAQAHFMPFASQIVEALSVNRLVVAIDGSQVGRGCMVLMVGVAYRNRLLPLTWLVYKGKKGHASAARHIQVLQQLQPLIPEDSEVVLLGDGEFDNVAMLEWVETNTSWEFVVRTAKSSQVWIEGKQERLEELAEEEGIIVSLYDTFFTSREYGPLNAIAWWGEGYEEPIYLLTNLQDTDEACQWYQKRALIETLFSDQKSRGFGIDKSHLTDPEKLHRLLVGACLAYIWMIWLGVEVITKDYIHLIDHNSRCDKSVFRLGLDWLKHLLKNGKRVIVSFTIPDVPKLSHGVM